MAVYLRLLRYLRPYRGRLFVALLCMALYALSNAAVLQLVSPFANTFFGRGGKNVVTTEIVTQEEKADILAKASEPLRFDHVNRWPAIVSARVQRTFLAGPLVALER